MKTRDMIKLGVPQAALPEAIKVMQQLAAQGKRHRQIETSIKEVLQTPDSYLEDAVLGEFALFPQLGFGNPITQTPH